MNTSSKLIATAIVLVGSASASFGQAATASTAASATIVSPISIEKTADFNFGRVAASELGGTVVLTPLAARSSSGVVLAGGGTVTAAAFTVTGEGTRTYSISFPSTVTLTKVSGTGETMTVDTWTTSAGAGTLTAGTQSFTAGATLHVGAAQATGVYTNSSFNVAVDYN